MHVAPQLSRLPIRQENKVMLLFKLGRVMELLLVPHGLFSLEFSTSLNYEPSLVCLLPAAARTSGATGASLARGLEPDRELAHVHTSVATRLF